MSQSIILTMHNANATAGLPLPPDRANDRSGETMPEGIACVLAVVRVLLAYGNHMLATLERRATQRSFSVIAQCFGTARLSVILVRLTRGVRRALALQRVLLARAAGGQDLVAEQANRYRNPREPSSASAADSQSDSRKPGSGPRADPDELLHPSNLPSVEEYEAEIRHQSVGQVIADICRDLGVSPFRCQDQFRDSLRTAITRYGGDDPAYVRDIMCCELAFLVELERTRDLGLDWPEQGRDAAHRVLGFLVGEEPVCPLPPLAPGNATALAATASRPPWPRRHADRAQCGAG